MKKSVLILIKCICVVQWILFPALAHANEKVKCPDGDHYIMPIDKITIKYHATRFESTLNGLAVLGISFSADPKSLQTAAVATQKLNEYIKALVLGYNSCAITREQYKNGLEKLYPRLEADAKELEKMRQLILKNEKINQERFNEVIGRYEQTLHEFARVSGNGIDYSRIEAIVDSQLKEIRVGITTMQEKQDKQIAKTDEIIKTLDTLKKVMMQGDPSILKQIPRTDKWDFSTGTISFWLRKSVFINKDTSSLAIISEDNSASIEFLKDSHNKVQVIFSYPTIGKIVRETQISSNEVGQQGVFIAFTWNLKEAETTLYINGEARK